MEKVYYKERQSSYMIIVLMGAIICFMLYAYACQIGTNPVTLPVLLFMLPLFMLFLLFFFNMTTTIYEDRIVVRYGVGWIKRTFYFSDLRGGEVKKTPWWYGAGIRYYPNGTLYSISFTDAAEFYVEPKSRHIAIGSSNPQLLLDKIRSLKGE